MREIEHIEKVVLAGSGVMGASFAQLFARHGFLVTLYDIAQTALDKADELIAVNQQVMVREGELGQAESDALRARIGFTLEDDAFRDADFVLEAIAEKMPIKHDFWRRVSALVGEDVVLATNTSGLSITDIAAAVATPARFAGMHWVNPPHLIPLVEVIAGRDSDDRALAVIRDVALRLGQKPVMVRKDPPGFVLNRLQYAVLREAFHIVESGYASMEDVDAVMKYGLGLRYSCIGPFETVDFGGVDTFNLVGSYMFGKLCNDTGLPRLLREAYEAGRLGVKTGAGLYDYPGDAAQKAIAKRDADFLKVSKSLFGAKREGE
ncbi:MAG: 3-hydroxyacyl-CoA dehydrogenase family protein [Planctomycetaceae bacterium]|nr:3-hydroxyacyl-CoA dehydrogenase family protein [Planctomycetaceae bacterium]